MQSSSLFLKEFGICFGAKVVLAEINLQLPTTGITVLMGPMGTGKSSMLYSLAGTHHSNPRFKHWGEAYLFEQPIDVNSNDAGSHPLLVRQNIAKLTEPVLNILLPMFNSNHGSSSGVAKHELVHKLITEAGADELLPMLQERLIDISPVWQRIVLILAASAAKPSLLMIDEPTSGLASAEAERMLALIRRIGENIKLIVVLHSQEQARAIADDIVLIAGGRVQFAGPSTAFFTGNHTSQIVNQFIKTGSVSVAAPDAKPETLSDATAQPPLPQAALDAIQAFLQPVEVTPEAVKPAPSALELAEVVAPAPDVPAAAVVEIVIEPAPSAPVIAEPFEVPAVVSVPKNDAPANALVLPVELSLPSKNGVGIVADIGKHGSNTSLGPAGFAWVVPDMLAGCPMPGVSAPIGYDLDLLAKLGVTTLITLTEQDLPQDELKAHGLSNVHLSIYDREAPSLPQMHMLLLRMQKLIEKGEVLAVHCLAGLGRTGTVLAAWMIKEGGLSADEAIRRLRLVNPGFVQSIVQETFLTAFENDILKRIR